jgi:mannose-6-phosphate isomerase
MPDLYPLLLQPQFHERVWGTRDLSPFYAREVVGGPIGEAWLTGDICSVVNGPLAGRMLSHLAQEFGKALPELASLAERRNAGMCCGRSLERRSGWD